MAALSSLEKARRLIQESRFAHPNRELLMSFLVGSVDENRAADYLLGVRDSSGDKIAGLSIVLSRWKSVIAIFKNGIRSRVYEEETVRNIEARDNVCFITGTKGSWKDPLVVTEIFPSISGKLKGPLREMLAAFLSPEHEDFLESQETSASQRQAPESNLWLIRSSAARAFSQGFFRVHIKRDTRAIISTAFVETPRSPTIVRQADYCRVKEIFTSRTAANLPPPNSIALDILNRLAHPIRWICLAELIPPQYAFNQISAPRSVHIGPHTWLSSIRNATIACMLALWLIFPISLRTMMYRFLAYIGSRFFRQSNSFKVQRLPFGMYLKTSSKEWHTSLSNEYKTLDLIRRQTDIPVPRPLDLVSDGECTYLLTSRVPGKPIGLCIDLLNDEQLRTFAHDLQSCLQDLRSLRRDAALESVISNTTGKACHDGRICVAVVHDETDGEFYGPFSTEDEFNKFLQSPHIPDVVHRNGHKIVFTHGDINMRNVLVDEKTGRLSGIVDWESAGWYPGYWEYTKAYFATRLNWRWSREVIEVVFKDFGDFSEELDIERKLWQYC
ncbi:kinase-like protein [Daldinia bambusicola]|nr:kinase-like protein [Daldinia bambusicola]